MKNNNVSNYEDAMQYINEQEATDISYVKVGNGKKKLIVSFASIAHLGFERKSSLMKWKFVEGYNFDVLYLRDQNKHWYLSELTGIGKQFDHTKRFFSTLFRKYQQVLCTGASMGGYASILYGSLLNVEKVVASRPPTDLQYIYDKLSQLELGAGFRNKLRHVMLANPGLWKKYKELTGIINDNVLYDVFYLGDDGYKKKNPNNPREIIVHGDYHRHAIVKHPAVHDESGKCGPGHKILDWIKGTT